VKRLIFREYALRHGWWHRSRFEESVCRRAYLPFRQLSPTDRATGQRRPFVTPGDRSPQDAQQRKISMTR